jgi:hypothetical protein
MRVNTAFKSFPLGAKIATFYSQDHVPEENWKHKPGGNKIAFYWENGQQKRRIINKEGVVPVDWI